MAVGGEDDKVVLRSVETFDPITLTWKPLACLPFAISKHGLVSVGKVLSRLNSYSKYIFTVCQKRSNLSQNVYSQ